MLFFLYFLQKLSFFSDDTQDEIRAQDVQFQWQDWFQYLQSSWKLFYTHHYLLAEVLHEALNLAHK